MNGNDVIAAIKRKLRLRTDQNLSARIGISVPAIQQWKHRKKVTPRQFAEMVHRASLAGASNLQANAICPIVEFFRINKCSSRGGAGFEVFAEKDGKDKNGNTVIHPYRNGLKEELKKHFGVYVFFDSRGQAIYAGKARQQKLWKEINLAFNRDRGEVQKIKRVKHPQRRQAYRTSDEQARQISDNLVSLHEIAAYFSAYQVVNGMIDDLESLLVRSFANDLLNIRMERFARHRN
jgi:hypothetical protein